MSYNLCVCPLSSFITRYTTLNHFDRLGLGQYNISHQTFNPLDSQFNEVINFQGGKEN